MTIDVYMFMGQVPLDKKVQVIRRCIQTGHEVVVFDGLETSSVRKEPIWEDSELVIREVSASALPIPTSSKVL